MNVTKSERAKVSQSGNRRRSRREVQAFSMPALRSLSQVRTMQAAELSTATKGTATMRGRFFQSSILSLFSALASAMLLPPFDLPQKLILLITDTFPSPASFLLHKALASHLKTPLSTSTTIVSVSEDLARWKAIASRSVSILYFEHRSHPHLFVT
jgi:hypothetical protein